MKVHVFTLRFDAMLGAFDETPLQTFLKDKHLISVADHFFTSEGRPCLVLVVTYRLHEVQPSGQSAPTGRQAKRDEWRSLLSPEDYPLFNTLREWRAERCKADGIPPYVICTNMQLAYG